MTFSETNVQAAIPRDLIMICIHICYFTYSYPNPDPHIQFQSKTKQVNDRLELGLLSIPAFVTTSGRKCLSQLFYTDADIGDILFTVTKFLGHPHSIKNNLHLFIEVVIVCLHLIHRIHRTHISGTYLK